MKTYVVMPHYIVTEELKQLATEAIKSFKENSDVILISVDDGSPLDCKFLEELSDIYIRNSKNEGFAKTCNTGFEAIKAIDKEDYYVICANNDILINQRVVPELKRPFEELENVAITGIFSTTEKLWEGKELGEVNLGLTSSGGMLDGRMQDGGLWMSKGSILNKIGNFDEQFLRGGFEDFDIFLRARDTFEMKIIMTNKAVYWHKQGATRWNANFKEGYAKESEKINIGNANKFCKKWGIELGDVMFKDERI